MFLNIETLHCPKREQVKVDWYLIGGDNCFVKWIIEEIQPLSSLQYEM